MRHNDLHDLRLRYGGLRNYSDALQKIIDKRRGADLMEFSVKFLTGGEVHALSVPRDTMLEHLAGNPKIEVRVEAVENRLCLTLRAGDLSIGEICVGRDGRPVTKDNRGDS